MTVSGMAERLLRRDKAVLIVLIGTLFGLAALYTVFGVGMNMTALQTTAMRGMRDMRGMNPAGNWSLGHAFVVFLMWWVMMIAMMLPSVSPTVLLYSALLRRGAEADHVPLISGTFLAGYLAAWAGFSVIAATTQWALEAAGVVSATMLTLVHTVPGALVLIAAGAFQFTPLKATCLRNCRSPAEFITKRRRPGAAGAFVMGVEHGVYCVGCCWFLMALLFVGGIMNLVWIAALTALVLAEKLLRAGPRFGMLIGGILIVWAIATLLV